jgi:uncharacterized membrane protein
LVKGRASQVLCWAAVLSSLLAGRADAEFRVCNQTKYLLNIAIGHLVGQEFTTEGWWSVTPSSCATPIKTLLTSRYLYLYAMDVDSADVIKGTVSMCVSTRKFQIFGVADCWRRGLKAVDFNEIDTANSPDWTVFLNDAGK